MDIEMTRLKNRLALYVAVGAAPILEGDGAFESVDPAEPLEVSEPVAVGETQAQRGRHVVDPMQCFPPARRDLTDRRDSLRARGLENEVERSCVLMIIATEDTFAR